MPSNWLSGDSEWPYPHPTKGWARVKFLLRTFWTGETPPIPDSALQEIRNLHAMLTPEMRTSVLEVVTIRAERRRESMTENANKGNIVAAAIGGTIGLLLAPAALAASGTPVHPVVWIFASLAIILELVAIGLISLANSPKSKITKPKAEPPVAGLELLRQAKNAQDSYASTIYESCELYISQAYSLHKRDRLTLSERLALRFASLLLCAGIILAILMIAMFAITQIV